MKMPSGIFMTYACDTFGSSAVLMKRLAAFSSRMFVQSSAHRRFQLKMARAVFMFVFLRRHRLIGGSRDNRFAAAYTTENVSLLIFQKDSLL